MSTDPKSLWMRVLFITLAALDTALTFFVFLSSVAALELLKKALEAQP
jgi:hypothetical protein